MVNSAAGGSGDGRTPADQHNGGPTSFLSRWVQSLFSWVYQICVTFFAVPTGVQHPGRRQLVSNDFQQQLRRRLLEDSSPPDMLHDHHLRFCSTINQALVEAAATSTPVLVFAALTDAGMNQVKRIWLALGERLNREFKMVGLTPDRSMLTRLLKSALGVSEGAEAEGRDLEIVCLLPYRFSALLIARVDSVMSMTIQAMANTANVIAGGLQARTDSFEAQEELFAEIQNAAITEASTWTDMESIDPTIRFVPGGILRVAQAKPKRGTSEDELIGIATRTFDHCIAVAAPLKERARRDQESIQSQRELRAEQERAFEESLRADQAKEEMRRRETEQRELEGQLRSMEARTRQESEEKHRQERTATAEKLLGAGWNQEIPDDEFIDLMIRLGPVQSHRVLFKVWKELPVGMFREIVGLSDVWFDSGKRQLAQVLVGVSPSASAAPSNIDMCAVKLLESDPTQMTRTTSSGGADGWDKLQKLYGGADENTRLRYELVKPREGPLAEDATIEAAGIVPHDALLYIARECL